MMPNDFHFQNPEYLWFVLLAPAMLWFSYATRNFMLRRLESFATADSLKNLLRGNVMGLSAWRRACFYVAIFLLALALARPVGNPTVEEQKSAGLDIVVLLDVSRSMDAEDIYPSRLKKAKREINTLLDSLSGDRVGIVAFAESAVLITPLTSDYEVVRSYLQAVDTNTIQNQGTNIERALDVAMKALHRGGENGLSEDNKSSLVILMSDGETHDGSTFEAVEKAHKEGITLYSIAFGTEKGVPIPMRDANGQLLTYKRDAKGETVISSVQPDSLKELASHGGGVFYFATLDEGEIHDIVARTQNMLRTSQKEIKARIYEEFFYYFLVPGFIFLLLSMMPALPVRTVTSIAFAMFLLNGKPATAAEAYQAPFLSKFWTKEKQLSEEATSKYKSEDYSGATDVLKKLQVDNPDSPEVSYDLGTSLVKEKKYEEGRAVLTEAEKSGSLAGLAAAMNLAGSYAEEQKKAEAQSSYSEIIHSLNTKENLSKTEKELLTLAKKNLERLSSTEEQKKQGGQDQQKQDDKNKQKQDQKQDEQKKEGQGDDKKKDEGKQDEQKQNGQDQNKKYDMRRQTFKDRENMSGQDAERMLEALKQQESSAQKKFLKKLEKNSNVKDNGSAKDW